ncbi:uncharacterized protein LOC114757550 [Neltuma alba]|uniref:uncharacterized protein LOC114757550 n=1 Tax=Neltuma alba TaxID=207710 RepID=UPI0010A2E092|nr:uncharacterized protein LOC114757550 [Prosopis alba]
MAENTRLKELQADMKKTNEFVEGAKGRFDQIDRRFDSMESLLHSLVQSMDSWKQQTESSPPRFKESTSGIPIVESVNFGQNPHKTIKVDFPHFDGSDALDWIFKAERYFKYFEIQDPQRLMIASVHLDGDVLPWFQMMEKSGRIPTWSIFAKAVEAQYGPTQFECPRSQLFKLTQQGLGGKLEEYNQKFLALANRTEEIPEAALLDCYLGGLLPELKRDVLLQRPPTVLHAMSIARLFTDMATTGFSAMKNSTGSGNIPKAIVPYTGARSNPSATGLGGGKSNLPPLLPTPKMPPIKKMTAAEMQIRREKGLYYTCDAKFTPTHRCPNKQLMLLQSEGESNEEEDETPEIIEADATLHHLSLYALRGTQGPATIRFQGTIQGTTVQILLDGGSSDNFIHPRIVAHLRLPIEEATPIRVLGGTGGKILKSAEEVRDVGIQINGHTIFLTLYVLPITGTDVVMGADWLETLGAHIADYSTSTIKFLQDGEWIALTGFRGPTVISAQFHHLSRLQQVEAVAEYFMLERIIDESEQGTVEHQGAPEELTNLLHRFAKVFENPHGLPPSRGHEHRIDLLPGTGPVRVRPYRYPVS